MSVVGGAPCISKVVACSASPPHLPVALVRGWGRQQGQRDLQAPLRTVQSEHSEGSPFATRYALK